MVQANMYELSVKQWNPFAGCNYSCKYCKTSFQLQAKRQKRRCMKCYKYTPHEHPNRLRIPLPATPPGKFIFTCSSGDIAFCTTAYLKRILARIQELPNIRFLIQSKNPRTFSRVEFPSNVILGTTLETNRDELVKRIATAPVPSARYAEFMTIAHPHKMVTCEPMMEFDSDVMLEWISGLKPEMVWIGYDSKKNNLPEPDLKQVEAFGVALGAKGIKVIYKKMREARPQIPEGSSKGASEKGEDGNMTDGKQSKKTNKTEKTANMKTTAVTRSPRLTATQKIKLETEYARHDSFKIVAARTGIGYNQVHRYLTAVKAGKCKPLSKSDNASAIVVPKKPTEMTAEELSQKIKDARAELVNLEAVFRATVKREQDRLDELKKLSEEPKAE